VALSLVALAAIIVAGLYLLRVQGRHARPRTERIEVNIIAPPPPPPTNAVR
jgi:hypothetical protein